MAKLKGPLFSLSASQKIADTLVYFNWKGLNVVREYVVPANPKTTLQKAQRTKLTEAVAAVHQAQAEAENPLIAIDVTAYALWASVVQPATTWFNQAVRQWIDRLVLGKRGIICRGCTIGGITATGCLVNLRSTQFLGTLCDEGQFRWGTSKTALINIKPANFTDGQFNMDATWDELSPKTKYYFQFEALATPDFKDAKSGIYSVTTLAE